MTPTANILESPMRIEKNIADELAARISRVTLIRRDEPLAKHTTMRIGGPADVYVEPASEADLAGIVKFCGERDVPFFILGRGSNLLVRDGGIRGVVICLAHPHFSKIEIVGERLHCGAGAKLKNVSVEAKRNNLTGVEFLEGIPGSVGGALRMNAGAMGAATFSAVESLRFMDHAGETHERVAGEVPVEYRACPLLKTHIALGAVFKCTPLPRAEIEQRMMAYSEKRWESQPAAPSAGCIFKNPGTVPAGKLVDELGLKGTRVGGAVVSAEHGNFIVNDGKATSRDVLELIALLKARAKEARGIELHTEVEIIGEEI
ncbi:MAG TPA: UDP-N-acetylmuramate dehydrogenase [Verrucomicrobiae bacterium]|nr:UDP-N-acetylmuramate dehydrogenase [Verrucomicrobiae bacterium]